MARVLGQDACTLRPAVWLLRYSQVVLGSWGLGGGGKLSALCQMADFGGLRQGGRVKYSSKKRLMSVPPLNGNFTRELSHIP